ncbi:unnamed protein product, partial [Symbiodinium sp. CCMP2592]
MPVQLLDAFLGQVAASGSDVLERELEELYDEAKEEEQMGEDPPVETEAVGRTRAEKDKVELQLMNLSTQAKKGRDLGLLQYGRVWRDRAVSQGMTPPHWESDLRVIEWIRRRRSGIKALYKPEDADKNAKKKRNDKSAKQPKKEGAKADEDEAEDDEGI